MMNFNWKTVFCMLLSLGTLPAYAQNASDEPLVVCAAEAHGLNRLLEALQQNGASIPPEMSSDVESWSEQLAKAAVPDASDGERGMMLFNTSKERTASLFAEANDGDLQTIIDARIALVRQCVADHAS